jgi:hypothetical protein
MLAVSPSALQDLAVELQGLVLVTKRANQELRKAHVRGMNGDVPPGRQIPAARSHVAGVCVVNRRGKVSARKNERRIRGPV